MVLIIEGVDGVGKTTICAELQKRLGWEVIHEGYPGEQPGIRKSRVERLEQNIKQNNNVIYDRCTSIDDFVYDFLNKEKSEISSQRSHIRELLNSKNVQMIQLVMKDREEHLKRFKARGDEFIKEDLFDKLYGSYVMFYLLLGMSANVDEVELTNDLEQNIQQIFRRILK